LAFRAKAFALSDELVSESIGDLGGPISRHVQFACDVVGVGKAQPVSRRWEWKKVVLPAPFDPAIATMTGR
jgi:hypothetical protein